MTSKKISFMSAVPTFIPLPTRRVIQTWLGDDIFGHGNESCVLPGQFEADAAKLTDLHGGLLFTRTEIEGFAHITDELGETAWKADDFNSILL
jgi:hypothetical protein